MLGDEAMSEKKGRVQLINLAKQQFKLDRIVFENIDTGNNWGKAQKLLSELVQESEMFFKDYIGNNDGQLPEVNAYWALFMDLVSKMTYFAAYAEYQLNPKPTIAEKYAAAASFLPNCELEGCIDFYEEICANYEAVMNEPLAKTNFTIQQTIENYYHSVFK